MRLFAPIKMTEEEKLNNTRLLKSFILAFISNDVHIIETMLHPNGRFFDRYNRTSVSGYYYKLFFGDNGINNRYHSKVNYGFALGQFSGQEVIELRFSNFDPFSDDSEKLIQGFGSPVLKEFDEVIFRFVFTFKDSLIYTIHQAQIFTATVENQIINN